METYHGNTVEYWKQNAEENYLTTPISVLKYITVLEEQAKKLHQPTVISAVCNSPCCKEEGVFELPLGSEWYCKEHYKQTNL